MIFQTKREGAKKANCPLPHNTYTISCFFLESFSKFAKTINYGKRKKYIRIPRNFQSFMFN